jgi:hypothetical protein
VTGTIAPLLAEPPVLAVLPPAAPVLPEPVLDELPPELQAARVAPAAQHASAIAILEADRPRAGLPWLSWFISLTMPSCRALGLIRCAIGRCAVQPAAAGWS